MTSPLSILEATDYSNAKTRAARSHPNGAGWGKRPEMALYRAV
jgi:hypothetical protein